MFYIGGMRTTGEGVYGLLRGERVMYVLTISMSKIHTSHSHPMSDTRPPLSPSRSLLSGSTLYARTFTVSTTPILITTLSIPI